MENYRCEKCGNETVSILGAPMCHRCGHLMKKIEPLIGKTESGANVPLDRLVMWRDVMPGELVESGDRMYVVGEGWKTAEETQCVGDTVGKHWIPIQRTAT